MKSFYKVLVDKKDLIQLIRENDVKVESEADLPGLIIQDCVKTETCFRDLSF